MLHCELNVWLPSFASKRNAWLRGETSRLREVMRPGAGLPSCNRVVWGVLTPKDSKFWKKKIVPLLRMLFCLALQWAVSFTSGDLSIKQQLSIKPVCTFEIMPRNWSHSPLWIYIILSSQWITAHTPPSVSHTTNGSPQVLLHGLGIS